MEKQKKKNNWRASKKQIDALKNQNNILEALTNKVDHKNIYKEIFDKLIQEKLARINELSDKIGHDDLIYYFKNDMNNFFFNDIDNGIELFRKIQTGKRS